MERDLEATDMAENEAPPKLEPLVPGTNVMPPAPQIQSMYGDPRLEGIKNYGREDRKRYDAPERRFLQPADPPRPNESRYIFARNYTFDPNLVRNPVKEFKFVETPNDFNDNERWGGGLGFDFIRGRHTVRGVLRTKVKAPEFVPAHEHGYAIVSSRALKLLQDFGVDRLEILPINWTNDSDPLFEGYVFLDVLRLIDAYDYNRCELVFRKIDGRMSGRLGEKRWFREGEIDSSIHLFHDFYERRRFVMSRKLWRYLHNHDVSGFYAVDPANDESALYHENLAAQAGDKS